MGPPVNDTRKGPWLSGLAAALAVAFVLIATVIAGTWQVLTDAADVSADTSYTP
jgi:hypothetical protein